MLDKTTEDLISFRKTRPLKKAIKDHNNYVEEQFRKAKEGQVINLTDLFISKEVIDERKEKRQQ